MLYLLALIHLENQWSEDCNSKYINTILWHCLVLGSEMKSQVTFLISIRSCEMENYCEVNRFTVPRPGFQWLKIIFFFRESSKEHRFFLVLVVIRSFSQIPWAFSKLLQSRRLTKFSISKLVENDFVTLRIDSILCISENKKKVALWKI